VQVCANRESYEAIPLTTLGFPQSSGLGSCHEFVMLGLDASSGSWHSGLRSPFAAMTRICIRQDLYDKLRRTYDGFSLHDRLGKQAHTRIINRQVVL